MQKVKLNELQICKEYKEGDSTLILGKKYKISYQTVNRIILRNNCKLRNHKEKTLNAIKQGRSSNSELQRKIVKERWQKEKNPRWSGGKYTTKVGYVRTYDDEGIYRQEHRIVSEKIIGRKLKRTETIHHINENKSDNRPKNLYYFSNDNLHKRHHGLKNKPKLKSNLEKVIKL